jgi:hypothetical protein
MFKVEQIYIKCKSFEDYNLAVLRLNDLGFKWSSGLDLNYIENLIKESIVRDRIIYLEGDDGNIYWESKEEHYRRKENE